MCIAPHALLQMNGDVTVTIPGFGSQSTTVTIFQYTQIPLDTSACLPGVFIVHTAPPLYCLDFVSTYCEKVDVSLIPRPSPSFSSLAVR